MLLSRRLGMTLAAVGVLAAALGTVLSANSASAEAAHPFSLFDRWPPRASDMVTAVIPSVSIPAGGTQTIYTVPSGKWFVLTYVSIGNTQISNGQPDVRLEEVIGGVTTVKLQDQFAYFDLTPSYGGGQSFHGPVDINGVGVAFAPGSSVNLTQPTINPNPFKANVTIRGYLTN